METVAFVRVSASQESSDLFAREDQSPRRSVLSNELRAARVAVLEENAGFCPRFVHKKRKRCGSLVTVLRDRGHLGSASR
jgi:hypothetical protein